MTLKCYETENCSSSALDPRSADTSATQNTSKSGTIKRSTRAKSKSSISIYKKRGAAKVTSGNLREFCKTKKILVDSADLNINDCLDLLALDISVANIVELNIKEFTAKFSELEERKVV